MKHLPNLLTLANLFCGCIAIAFALNSQPFQVLVNGLDYYYVTGTEQACWAAVFIGTAGIFDLLDGLVARALNIHSPIGKDLDSLADVVSFGVAPAMILFKMLWAAYMSQPDALDVSMVVTTPAFLIACFAALRLARFNVTPPSSTGSFTGMPAPAAGIFVASFPLVNYYNPFHLGEYMQQKWIIYALIALLCWLMVSRVGFFKLLPYRWNAAQLWPRVILVLLTLAAIPLLKIAAIPFAFVLYIILSFIYREPGHEAAGIRTTE